VGEAASESQLKRHASNYRHLHLATHGLVDDQFPLGSGVLLAGDRDNDGLLQVAEVLDLDLRAELVTLSACRSGRGRLGRGEGIVGLGQAFLYAGASSLVLSLWDVDDSSTPRLMERFYRHLTTGRSPAEALRDARRELVGETEERHMVFRRRPMSLAHPRFWSAFVVTGDG
ncbi:MAG: CHAT domain-containing protein, partial [Acidobacteriota bacterium]